MRKKQIIGWAIYLSGVFAAYPCVKYQFLHHPGLTTHVWDKGNRIVTIMFSTFSWAGVLFAGGLIFIDKIDFTEPASW